MALLLAACGRRDFDAIGDGGRADGRIDDGPIGDGANGESPGLCPHTFCGDGGGWDNLSQTGGGVLATGAGVTATTPATGDTAFAEKTFHATSSIVIGFTLAYTTTGTNANTELDLVQLKWATPAPGCTEEGYFIVKDGTGPIDLQETYATCGGNFDITYGTLEGTGPHAFVLRIGIGPPTRERFVFDGTTLTSDIATQHDAPASDVLVRVGAAGDRNLDGTWEFAYSDLYVDVDQ